MNSIPTMSSDLPYSAYACNDTTTCVADTEEGRYVARLSEKLRSSSVIEPKEIALISLAAAAHPDALNGRTLLWVDHDGEAIMAFEPDTQWLWCDNLSQRSLSDHNTVVLNFMDGQYRALVDGVFITLEGDDAFYKALLTAVHQRGAGIVTDREGEELRNALTVFMNKEAERLASLWLNIQRAECQQEMAMPASDITNNPSFHTLVDQCSIALSLRGEFRFSPKITHKGMLLGSISCWITGQQWGGINRAYLANDALPQAAKKNIAPPSSTLQYDNIVLGLEKTNNGQASNSDAVLPLMVSTGASVAISHPARSNTVRTIIAGLGVTGIFVAGKKLFSWYQGRNVEPDVAMKQQHSDSILTPPKPLRYHSSPPTLQLENTDHDFSISDAHVHPQQSMTDEEKIAYRLTLFTPVIISTSTVTTTTWRETDDVRIEKFSLSCVEKGLQISISDVFRQIGETLSYPVEELIKAVPVILYYEQFGLCPSEKDIEKLEFIATGIDTFISTLLPFIPGGNTLSLLQNIGGPLFQLIADAIDGKDLDMGNVSAVNEQVAFLARTTLHAVSVKIVGTPG